MIQHKFLNKNGRTAWELIEVIEKGMLEGGEF